MSMPDDGCVIVDCDKGRELGCRSFCCTLIVRLGPGERDPGDPGNAAKHCVDKDPSTGRCVHQDPAGRCTVWAARPAICRAYDCNDDPSLQVVLRRGFRSLIDLVTAPPLGAVTKIRVPYLRRD